LESNPIGFSAYNAGLVNVRVTAPHIKTQHVLCGRLRRPGTFDLAVTNIRFHLNPLFPRSWCFAFADERINYATGQMQNWFGAPPHWPYGLNLEEVPDQVDT